MTAYPSCHFKNFIGKIVEKVETKFLALLVKHLDMKEYGALSFSSTHSQTRPLYTRWKSCGNFRQEVGRTPEPYWTLCRGKVFFSSRHQGVWGVEFKLHAFSNFNLFTHVEKATVTLDRSLGRSQNHFELCLEERHLSYCGGSNPIRSRH